MSDKKITRIPFEKLKNVMDERKITLNQVSQDTGIAYSSLHGWMSGQYEPNADKLFILSETYEKPMEYWMEKIV